MELTARVVVDHVSVGHGDASVVNDVSFDAGAGTFVAVLGPNGCGKTTLISALVGLHPLTSGSVQLGGHTTDSTGRRRKAKGRALATSVALVSQAPSTTFPFSVIDMVLTGRLPYVGLFAGPGAGDLDVAHGALDRLGISHLAERTFTQLSGGERQMVLLARALAQETTILVLDEPTTYLDLANQERVLSTVRKLADEAELTVIAILHDPNHAVAYADQVLLMASVAGTSTPSTVEWGPPAVALTPASMRAAYGIDVDVIRSQGHRLVVPRRAHAPRS